MPAPEPSSASAAETDPAPDTPDLDSVIDLSASDLEAGPDRGPEPALESDATDIERTGPGREPVSAPETAFELVTPARAREAEAAWHLTRSP